MQSLSEYLPTTPHGGGRLRPFQCNGLTETTDRFQLLLLIKRAGKSAGFTSRMIQLLEYYVVAFTRDQDWEEGAHPIVYQSLAKTALDLGISERQIQRIEKSLTELGAISHHDSGNHRRYGKRCSKSGEILYAYGVDLSPLAELKPSLERALEVKELHDKAWLETKRQISWYRGQIRKLIEATGSRGLNNEHDFLIAPIRTHMDLARLRTLLARHKDLHQELASDREEGALHDDMTSVDDENVVHKEDTNNQSSDKSESGRDKPSCFQGRQAEGLDIQPDDPEQEEGPEELILSTGLQHISLKQALNAASPRFREHIPMHPRPMNWTDLVEAAYRLRSQLPISQESWALACSVLRRNGAAICLLLTDQAMQREHDPVRNPGAYFRSMITRVGSRELNLHAAVFGILKRETINETVA